MPAQSIPRHVAVIMDGNGRWAQGRGRPRGFGHRAGVQRARRIVRACHKHGVGTLTVFAFSQENWKRPASEVSLLMQLFLRTLSRELDTLHKNDIRLRFLGDHADFSPELRTMMRDSEQRTAHNQALQLVVAVGYGGQWDIVQAAEACVKAKTALTPENVERHLQTAGLPPVDLLIRTGGERRISNFMLWQLAYTELYFSNTLWPDFGEDEFARALAWYAGRERRFGRVPEAA
ncbi:MAG: di-trans,poly-cis-decaprenylcistransferase [Hydrocarboniphaga effusa]|nr:di-trans,poly-cis-decaprenylcistransferase [Hydrocarboniphaga effusa]